MSSSAYCEKIDSIDDLMKPTIRIPTVLKHFRPLSHPISIDDGVVDTCFEFAKKVVPTTLEALEERGQNNELMILRQNFCGKIAEFGVAKELRMRGFDVSEPDVKIYKKSGKSWDSDLKIASFDARVAVKSWSQDLFYSPCSWTFQKGAKSGHKDKEIFGEYPIFVCFAVVSLVQRKTQLVSMMMNTTLFEREVFFDPKCDWLKKEKTCVYPEIPTKNLSMFVLGKIDPKVCKVLDLKRRTDCEKPFSVIGCG